MQKASMTSFSTPSNVTPEATAGCGCGQTVAFDGASQAGAEFDAARDEIGDFYPAASKL